MTATTEIEIPNYCGPLSDLNRDQTCKRAGWIYTLRSWQADIDREIERLPRLRGRNADRRRANLARWIERAQERQDRVAARVLAELPECTHPEAERREISDTEDALPSCTCGA